MKESLVTKMLAFVMALFTGCSKFDREVMSDNQEAKQIMEQVIGYLQDGNADGVKELLSPKTISECKDNIDNQIEEAITAFSGKKRNHILQDAHFQMNPIETVNLHITV